MFPNPDRSGSIYDSSLVEDDANSARRGENFVSAILEETVCELDEAVGDYCVSQCLVRNVIVIEVCENCNIERWK